MPDEAATRAPVDESVRQSLLGRAREFAGRLHEDPDLEREGRDQAERGRRLREERDVRDRSRPGR